MKRMLPLLALMFVSCTPSDAPTAGGQPAAGVHPEQALIEELVLANRMLASEELGVLDAFGHVSVRSRVNPNRYYISRYVSPGIVTTGDIIENDLDSQPVAGPRRDEYQEVHIHGEIYKARPDVMAVVHAHTPELVAFSVSSVPLRNGDAPVPVWDVRKFNNGRSGGINNPRLGQAMAETLGDNSSVLLLGHGVVVTSSSIYNLVSAASGLRSAARLQQTMIAMGGTWDPNPRRVAAQANTPPPPPPAAEPVPSGTGGGRGGDRAWEYWKQMVLKETGGSIPAATPPAPATPPNPDDAIKQDLALASRMLAHPDIAILDAFGHVSVRSPANPSHYFIPRYVSAGVVKAGDIIENDLDSQAVGAPRNDQFQEIYMHGEIYKARPDVMAVVHAHTPEIVAFTQSSIKLRPVANGGTFIGDGLPMFDIRKFDPRETIITSAALGRSVAEVMGAKPAVLLTGHGIALTDTSLYALIGRAYNLRMNAKIQQQAIALRGAIAYLDNQPPAPVAVETQPLVTTGDGGGFTGADRAWEYWKRIVDLN